MTILISVGIFCVIVGLMAYACCIAAGRADDRSEKAYHEWRQKHDKTKK